MGGFFYMSESVMVFYSAFLLMYTHPVRSPPLYSRL